MLYLLTPVLNKVVDGLDYKIYKASLIVMFVVFSVLSTIYPFEDTFQMNAGQSLTWFVFLYLFAAFISKYSEKLGKWSTDWKFAIFFLAGGFGLSFISKVIISVITKKFVGDIVGSAMFIKYNSFTVFAESVGFLLLFRNLSITSNIAKMTINFLRPHTLAAYLITENLLLKDYVWEIGRRVIPFSNISWPIISVLYIMVLFLLCVILDYIRKVLFDFFHISSALKRIDEKTGKLFSNETCT